MQICLCECRSDRHRLAIVVVDVMFVPLEREPKVTALARLVDDRDEREGLHVIRRLGQPQVKFPTKSMSLASTISTLRSFPSPSGRAPILDGLRLEAILPALLRVEVADILVCSPPDCSIDDDVELLPLKHEVSWGKATVIGLSVMHTFDRSSSCRSRGATGGRRSARG